MGEDKSIIVQPEKPRYSTGYEHAKRDIEIEEEKAARIKNEQLKELRRKEKKASNRSGSGKRTGESLACGGASTRSRPY